MTTPSRILLIASVMGALACDTGHAETTQHLKRPSDTLRITLAPLDLFSNHSRNEVVAFVQPDGRLADAEMVSAVQRGVRLVDPTGASVPLEHLKTVIPTEIARDRYTAEPAEIWFRPTADLRRGWYELRLDATALGGGESTPDDRIVQRAGGGRELANRISYFSMPVVRRITACPPRKLDIEFSEQMEQDDVAGVKLATVGGAPVRCQPPKAAGPFAGQRLTLDCETIPEAFALSVAPTSFHAAANGARVTDWTGEPFNRVLNLKDGRSDGKCSTLVP